MLSFFNIFGILHNHNYVWKLEFQVVNCFHFSISLGYYTTIGLNLKTPLQLWIAFIFQYLWDITQRSLSLLEATDSCELLSFFNIFGILHNNLVWWWLTRRVVNCFHFSISLGYYTTGVDRKRTQQKLWIAFIFQYLWDITQRRQELQKKSFSCELLSFFNIFGILHNLRADLDEMYEVVNCFHFSISLGYYTTNVL